MENKSEKKPVSVTAPQVSVHNDSKYESISFGIFLLFVGTVAIMANFGILNWSWGNLFNIFATYWPAFIILLGVKIVIETLPFGKLLGIALDVVVYLAIIGMLVYLPNLKQTQTPVLPDSVLETEHVSIERTDNLRMYTKKKYLFTIGAAQVNISDSDAKSTPENMIYVSGPMDKNSAYATVTYAPVSALEVPISFENKFKNNMPFGAYQTNNVTYTVSLGATELPANFDFTVGASKTNINLTKTQVTDFTAKVGAGEFNAQFGGASVPQSITAKVGAGKITLTFPKDTNVSVAYKVGLGNVKITSASKNINKSFGGVASTGSYQTSSNTNSVKISADAGAGEIEIVLE